MGCETYSSEKRFPGSNTVFEPTVPAGWSSDFNTVVKALNDSESGYSCTINGGRAFTDATCAEISSLVNPV